MDYSVNIAIGQVKCKAKVYCMECGDSYTRNLKVNVYEDTPEAITKAKEKIKARANKEYTCRICKTIIQDLKNIQSKQLTNF